MTSVKQLSKDLNISTVRLYQIINELPETQKPSKKGNRYIFTDKDIATIKERFKQTTYNLTKVSNDKSANQLIHQLNKQIESLTKQINIKDKQIEKLTQLVDQSQQLVLNAQKQIESKTDTSNDVDKGASYPSASYPSHDSKTNTSKAYRDSYTSPDSKANKAIKHWWQR